MTKKKTSAPKADANDQRKPDTLDQQEGAEAAQAAASGDQAAPATDAQAGDDAARKNAKENPRAAPAAVNLARKLMLFMIEELKALPKPWQQLSEVDQDDVIQRLRKAADIQVAEAITIAASGGDYSKAVLELVSVAVKNKTSQVVLTIPTACNKEIKDLLDVRGQAVCLLLGVDPKNFGVGNDQVRAEPQQKALPVA